MPWWWPVLLVAGAPRSGSTGSGALHRVRLGCGDRRFRRARLKPIQIYPWLDRRAGDGEVGRRPAREIGCDAKGAIRATRVSGGREDGRRRAEQQRLRPALTGVAECLSATPAFPLQSSGYACWAAAMRNGVLLTWSRNRCSGRNGSGGVIDEAAAMQATGNLHPAAPVIGILYLFPVLALSDTSLVLRLYAAAVSVFAILAFAGLWWNGLGAVVGADSRGLQRHHRPGSLGDHRRSDDRADRAVAGRDRASGFRAGCAALQLRVTVLQRVLFGFVLVYAAWVAVWGLLFPAQIGQPAQLAAPPLRRALPGCDVSVGVRVHARDVHQKQWLNPRGDGDPGAVDRHVGSGVHRKSG